MLPSPAPAGKRASPQALLALLALLVLCPACSSVRPPPERPATVVFAFADGFHSGIILDREVLPPGFDPQPVGDSTRWPWVAVHFGELHWMAGEASGAWDACKLAMVPGPGGVQCDHLPGLVSDCGGTNPARMRIWPFVVDMQALDGLRTRLWTWADPTRVARRSPESPTWAYGCRRDWSVWCNCHDFTADILDGAGIRVPRSPIMLADGFRADLDEVWAAEQSVAAPARTR